LATTYTYDFDPAGVNANRMAGYLAKIDYNDSGVPVGEISTTGLTFDYDRRGRTRTATQGALTTTLNWHPAGALDSETYAGSFLGTLSVVAGNVDPGNILRRASLEARKSGTAIAGTTVIYGYDTASRLQTLSSSGVPSTIGFSATYNYLANSYLLSTTTFKQDATTRLTAAPQFDFLNRMQSITPTPSAAGQPALSRAYVYNQANQRVVRTEGDSSFWLYEYDNKGQVTEAKHAWVDKELVPGQQFEYAYDDIGNRLLAREGGDQNGIGLRQTTYVPNNVNQYASRSMNVADRKVDIMGLALVQNGTPTSVTINSVLPSYRRGEYFWKAVAGSGAGPDWLGFTFNRVVRSLVCRFLSSE
jgi:hypothetical protein